MARIFKSIFTNRQGVTQKTQKWYVTWRDQYGKPQTWAGFKAKRDTVTLGENLERLVDHHVSTGAVDPKLRGWLDRLEDKQRDKLVELGLLPAERYAARQSLVDHLTDWEISLDRAGNKAASVELVTGRARKVFDGIGAKKISDLSAKAVGDWLEAEMKPQTVERDGEEITKPGMSLQTRNHYARAVKQFSRWLVRECRASEDVLARIKQRNVETDRRLRRRALTEAELLTLFDCTADGPERYGMSGPERALLYRVAVGVGIRANEVRTLTVRDLELRGKRPTLTVQAQNSKNRKKATLPLPAELVAPLRKHVKMMAPAAQLFAYPVYKRKASDMFKADLEAAGIERLNEAGETVDFHSLRHTAISRWARAGVPLAHAQKLARHSTPMLTANVYTHLGLDDLGEHIDGMPSLTDAAESDALAATGTDDDAAGVFLSGSPRNGGQRRKSVDNKPRSRGQKRGRGARVADAAGLENRSTGEIQSDENTEKKPAKRALTAEKKAALSALLATLAQLDISLDDISAFAMEETTS